MVAERNNTRASEDYFRSYLNGETYLNKLLVASEYTNPTFWGYRC